MITLRINNLDQIKAAFSGIRDDQLPYATALALTRTAQDAQKFVQQTTLPQQFVLRSPDWMKLGVRTQMANKQTLQAMVYDLHQFMALQESGGEKLAYKGYIAVPLSGIRPWGGRALIPENMRPHAVMTAGGFIRDGIMYAVVLRPGSRRTKLSKQIKGITRAASWSRQILPVYALVKEAKVPARYEFAKSVADVVNQNFGENFLKAWLQAMKTAR